MRVGTNNQLWASTPGGRGRDATACVRGALVERRLESAALLVGYAKQVTDDEYVASCTLALVPCRFHE